VFGNCKLQIENCKFAISNSHWSICNPTFLELGASIGEFAGEGARAPLFRKNLPMTEEVPMMESDVANSQKVLAKRNRMLMSCCIPRISLGTRKTNCLPAESAHVLQHK
jgi:hypothetical protein